MLKDLVQNAQQLPHLGRDGLTGQAKRQGQDLLIKLCSRQETKHKDGFRRLCAPKTRTPLEKLPQGASNTQVTCMGGAGNGVAQGHNHNFYFDIFIQMDSWKPG